MKRSLMGFGALAAVAMLLMLTRAQAQTAARANAAQPPRYDAAREITIAGSVDSLVAKPGPGMLAGAHVIVATAAGTVDAHLGNYALKGPKALTFTPGENVKLVGVMTNILGRQVFLVRTVRTGSLVYEIRNARGFLIRTGHALIQDRTGAAREK
jgi:hypothetical protein